LSESEYFCGNCGKELAVDEIPCSSCGSTKRNIHVFISETLAMRDSLKGEVRDQKGKTKSKFYVRSKVSKQGKEAKEELTIDIAGNRKYHHVEEQDKNGHWTTVHHEDEPLKKKERK
jgi:hypothetical protein